jgi:hypothetical protein
MNASRHHARLSVHSAICHAEGTARRFDFAGVALLSGMPITRLDSLASVNLSSGSPVIVSPQAKDLLPQQSSRGRSVAVGTAGEILRSAENDRVSAQQDRCHATEQFAQGSLVLNWGAR